MQFGSSVQGPYGRGMQQITVIQYIIVSLYKYLNSQFKSIAIGNTTHLMVKTQVSCVDAKTLSNTVPVFLGQ